MGAETSLSRRCDEAERDIEATRRRIQDKAGSLEDRLKPEALLRPARKRLESTLGAGGAKVLDAFRENPIPLALTGLGLGWLLLRDLRGERPVASKVKDTASEAVQKARETARRTSDWLSETLEEKPLLLAVGALAAGLLAAFAVARTSQEKKLGEKAAPDTGTEVDAVPGGLPSA